MGQKVNPHGIRVGVIKDWDSRWFASKKDFSDNLVEDHKIRTELKAQLKDAGVPKIEIERTVDPSTSAPRVTVNIYCAKPGMVIGKGGDTIDIDFAAGIVYRNGVALDEPYTAEPTYLYESVDFPITVPDGCLFLMGDNRNNSTDSRDTRVGCVDERDIMGAAVLRVLPFGKIGAAQ